MASRARQSLTLRTSTLTSTCGWVEGLDITWDNLAGSTDVSWWMIGCKCVIHEWNEYVLKRLYLEVSENDWGAISKEENPLRIIDRPSDRGQASHLRAIGLQESKQLIWQRSDRNQLTKQATEQAKPEMTVLAKPRTTLLAMPRMIEQTWEQIQSPLTSNKVWN